MRKREFSSGIPVGYARPLVEQLRRLDGDLDALWQEAHIQTPWRAVLGQDVASLPAPEFTRLYRHGVGMLERRCCEREDRRPLGKLAVNMLCYCVIHCATLREAVERAARFNDAMADRGGELRLQQQGAQARFTMDAHRRHRDEAALWVDLTGLYFYHQLFSWLIGRPLPLHEVGVAYARPDEASPLLGVFGAPLRFDETVNALSFEARLLDHKVVRSYAELEAIIDCFPFDLGLAGVPESALRDQVRLLLLDALQHRGRAPDCSAVAQLFHTSTATLRRRLRAEGISFVELRAGCQREAAQYLLAHTAMPVDDIASRLGLSGDRALRRAFRQWTGTSPSSWRLRSNTGLDQSDVHQSCRETPAAPMVETRHPECSDLTIESDR
jgi:AraC-like DNA-binding protein